MFQPLDLYTKYKERAIDILFSSNLPEVSKKTTLDRINYAINLCDKWETCMDIGCGSGHYLSALSAKFDMCIGVEIDVHPEQEILAERYSNVKFFNDRIENYNTNSKFDFILLMDIYEHIPNIKDFIHKISTFQDSGGIIYIVTPNPIFVGPATESEIFHTDVGYHGHIKHYTRNEIVEVMTEGGYSAEFFLYEETPQRQTIKRITKGISRKDVIWKNNLLYRIIRPLLMLILRPCFRYLEHRSALIEDIHKDDQYNTMAQAIAFKKR